MYNLLHHHHGNSIIHVFQTSGNIFSLTMTITKHNKWKVTYDNCSRAAISLSSEYTITHTSYPDHRLQPTATNCYPGPTAANCHSGQLPSVRIVLQVKTVGCAVVSLATPRMYLFVEPLHQPGDDRRTLQFNLRTFWHTWSSARSLELLNLSTKKRSVPVVLIHN